LDETVGPETGYPKYFPKSHKMEQLPTDLKKREAMAKAIQLGEGDVIIRDGQIRVQGTGVDGVISCSMILQCELSENNENSEKHEKSEERE
jgi:hypothetical protein